MLSSDASNFIKRLTELYKATGVNSFTFEQYMDIPNYSSALKELMDAGYLSWKDDRKNILGTVVVNFDASEED